VPVGGPVGDKGPIPSWRMDLEIEFTIEPFVEGNPGPHVKAGIEAVRRAGLAVEMGPFGSTASGRDDVVLGAVGALCRQATAAGADRISLQLRVVSP
jgi:uncharacterized protein YqgV (UPF0045/DUF77 family)